MIPGPLTPGPTAVQLGREPPLRPMLVSGFGPTWCSVQDRSYGRALPRGNDFTVADASHEAAAACRAILHD